MYQFHSEDAAYLLGANDALGGLNRAAEDVLGTVAEVASTGPTDAKEVAGSYADGRFDVVRMVGHAAAAAEFVRVLVTALDDDQRGSAYWYSLADRLQGAGQYVCGCVCGIPHENFL